jgi:glyceraldehyde-3-phosphate dehydrogenase/erythrose-4-phosphate dehydrogenase
MILSRKVSYNASCENTGFIQLFKMLDINYKISKLLCTVFEFVRPARHACKYGHRPLRL